MFPLCIKIKVPLDVGEADHYEHSHEATTNFTKHILETTTTI